MISEIKIHPQLMLWMLNRRTTMGSRIVILRKLEISLIWILQIPDQTHAK